MGQAAVAHIACHGVFEPDQPDQSGFVLTSAAGRLGMLTIRDLAQADLTAIDQAVLTSCWGADSFILPGRFIISLPETLWRAGARTILACLWEVSDGVASPFIRTFYRNLRTMRRDEALREVQRQCRASILPGCATADTSDPYYWAGFQIFGEGAHLHR
jgi:CHAT domain-containing protein